MEQIILTKIEEAMTAMFPHGAGNIPHMQVRHHLENVATVAFREGKSYALLGLMTVEDVAAHLGVSRRRANALIKNRHERFGVGMKFGSSWLIHRDELPQLEPDSRYRSKQTVEREEREIALVPLDEQNPISLKQVVERKIGRNIAVEEYDAAVKYLVTERGIRRPGPDNIADRIKQNRQPSQVIHRDELPQVEPNGKDCKDKVEQ